MIPPPPVHSRSRPSGPSCAAAQPTTCSSSSRRLLPETDTDSVRPSGPVRTASASSGEAWDGAVSRRRSYRASISTGARAAGAVVSRVSAPSPGRARRTGRTVSSPRASAPSSQRRASCSAVAGSPIRVARSARRIVRARSTASGPPPAAASSSGPKPRSSAAATRQAIENCVLAWLKERLLGANVVAAFEDGMYSPSLKERLSALEVERAALTAEIGALGTEAPEMLLPANLPELY
ncbi:hypothetical protein [Roseomonas genomospecies 6]|uniref:hypothetical protein n=1 Tax=Roseomonas genomospecies 6 TaxID=214106 RepID=UPI00256FE433|nr:hypothetical protein [Roseomonas genomospecies 6]